MRVLVLASGTGTLLQALLDAATDSSYPDEVVAAGADRDGTAALERATHAAVPTFVLKVPDFGSRAEWDIALTQIVAGYEPDLVVLAGFMKLAGSAFLERFGGRIVNTHPALSPAFPGMHSARDALDYGVKVTGCTLFIVDDGVDTGPIVAQVSVPVLPDDDEASLHERIKEQERILLVDSVARMAREGWTVDTRKVTIP
jgi:phosphoribosylglycinamide formyltransferase-1